MAEKLNPPSHFLQPVLDRKIPDGGKSTLLPPSMFAKPTPHESSKALAKAQDKIDELKQENQQLRKNRQLDATTMQEYHSQLSSAAAPSESVPQRPPSLPAAHHLLHLEHTTDVLSKQAAQIAELRSEVNSLRSRRESEVRELEGRLREMEAKHAAEVTSLKADNRCQEEEHKRKMKMAAMMQEAVVTERQDKTEKLTHELTMLETQYENDTRQLKRQLVKAEEERDETMDEAQTNDREKAYLIESLQKQLSQLRTYIGETEDGRQSALKWQQEKEKHQKQLKSLEKDLDNERSATQHLNVRLTSTSHILGIQEMELARTQGGPADNRKRLQALLSRWREKVFELLVQLKSQEIAVADMNRKHSSQFADLEDTIASLQNQHHLLEHSIADRDARLQLERGQNMSLQDELASIQEVAELLDSRLRGYDKAVPQLAVLLKSVQMGHTGGVERLSALMPRLASYHQRISFAVSRMDILKGLLSRKEAMWSLRTTEVISTDQALPEEDLNAQNDSDRLSPDQLEKELHQVTQERDSLAKRIKRDSIIVQEQLTTAKTRFTAQQEQDTVRMKELEKELEEKSKDLEVATKKIDSIDSEWQDSLRNIGDLKTELAKLQHSMERSSADKMVAMETKLTNQLTETERRLNDARRKQAKAVVSLRQLERQGTRERDRAAEILKIQEEHLRLEIERVTSQWREAERDKNLLMATLKQEGLISQYKTQRAAVRRLDDEAATTMSHRLNSQNAVRPEKPKDPIQQKAPLSTILTDLKSLAAQVLTDDGDDQTT